MLQFEVKRSWQIRCKGRISGFGAYRVLLRLVGFVSAEPGKAAFFTESCWVMVAVCVARVHDWAFGLQGWGVGFRV